MSTPKKIALIIGSTRTPRVGLPISHLILSHLRPLLPSPTPSDTDTNGTPAPAITLELLDLMDHQLPYLSEPGIPMHITTPSSYVHASTRAWSALISSYSAFVFVTPQYNWGIPGGLKNNIDHLYNEWKGKPAMVVSYGGRGGGKAGEQLVGMLKAMKMGVLEERVELNLNLVDGGMDTAAWKGELNPGLEGKWEENGELGRARKVFGEVVAKLVEGEKEKGA